MKLPMEIVHWGLSEETADREGAAVLGDWQCCSRLSQGCRRDGDQARLKRYSRVTPQTWLCTESISEEESKQK